MLRWSLHGDCGRMAPRLLFSLVVVLLLSDVALRLVRPVVGDVIPVGGDGAQLAGNDCDTTTAYGNPPQGMNSTGDCPTLMSTSSSCSVTCGAGYYVSQPQTTCDGLGNLSPQSCLQFGCTMPQITNGNFGNCTSTVASGSSCSINCDSGYQPVGTTTCSSGTFTSMQHCSPLGNISLVGPQTTTLYCGETLTYHIQATADTLNTLHLTVSVETGRITGASAPGGLASSSGGSYPTQTVVITIQSGTTVYQMSQMTVTFGTTALCANSTPDAGSSIYIGVSLDVQTQLTLVTTGISLTQMPNKVIFTPPIPSNLVYGSVFQTKVSLSHWLTTSYATYLIPTAGNLTFTPTYITIPAGTTTPISFNITAPSATTHAVATNLTWTPSTSDPSGLTITKPGLFHITFSGPGSSSSSSTGSASSTAASSSGATGGGSSSSAGGSSGAGNGISSSGGSSGMPSSSSSAGASSTGGVVSSSSTASAGASSTGGVGSSGSVSSSSSSAGISSSGPASSSSSAGSSGSVSSTGAGISSSSSGSASSSAGSGVSSTGTVPSSSSAGVSSTGGLSSSGPVSSSSASPSSSSSGVLSSSAMSSSGSISSSTGSPPSSSSTGTVPSSSSSISSSGLPSSSTVSSSSSIPSSSSTAPPPSSTGGPSSSTVGGLSSGGSSSGLPSSSGGPSSSSSAPSSSASPSSSSTSSGPSSSSTASSSSSSSASTGGVLESSLPPSVIPSLPASSTAPAATSSSSTAAPALIGDPIEFRLTLGLSLTTIETTYPSNFTSILIHELSTQLGVDSSRISLTSVAPGSTDATTSVTITIQPSTNPAAPTPTVAVTQLQTSLATQNTITSTLLSTAVTGTLVTSADAGWTPISSSSTSSSSSSSPPVSSSSSSTGSTVSSSTVDSSSTGAANEKLVSLVTAAAAAIADISPPITVSVTVVDPCTLHPGFCLNHGACQSTVVNSTAGSSTQLVQLSCSCPKAFFGPHCEVGILACTNGCTSRMGGNSSISLYGIGLKYVNSLVLAGLSLTYSHDPAIAMSDPKVTGEIKTKRDGGPWDDWVHDDYQQVDVVSFKTVPITSLTTTTTTTTHSYHHESTSMYTITENSFLVTGEHDSTMLATTAAPKSSYQSLVVHAVFPSNTSSTPIEIPYSVSPVYYSVSNCGVNQFQDSIGDCIPCPEGCSCPGGGRCWTLPGYWSYSQSSLPVKCAVPENCPGVATSSSSAFTTGSMTGDNGLVDTQVCATGYTGVGCLSCDSNYYQLNSRCYSCGSSNDQTGQMVSILLAAAGVTIGLSLGIALLDVTKLVYLVTIFQVVQLLAATGQSGAQNVPGSAGKALATFFSYISVVNFDLQILHPGCTVPSITFLTIFWATMGLVVFNAVLFFLACLLRYFVRVIAEKAGRGLTIEQQRELTKTALVEAKKNLAQAAQKNHLFHTPAKEDFRRRLFHSYLILGTIFYLQLTTRMIKMYQCTLAPDPQSPFDTSPSGESLYLTADYQTPCYSGAHLGTVIFVSLLFVVYSFGFPFAIFVLLCRTFADPNSTGVIGWLYHRYKLFRPNQTRKEELKAAYKVLAAQESAAEQVSAAMNAEDATKKSEDKYAVTKPASHEILDPALTALYVEHRRLGLFGYLFLDIRHETFPYRLLAIVINFFFALITSLVDDNITQLFLLGLCFSVDALIVCWYMPFTMWYDNTRAAGIAILSLGHSVLMIAIQTDATRSGYFYSGLFIFILICLSLAFRNRIIAWLNRRIGSSAAMVNNKTGAIESGATNDVMVIRTKGSAPVAPVGEGLNEFDSDLDFSITGESIEARERRLGLRAPHEQSADPSDDELGDDFDTNSFTNEGSESDSKPNELERPTSLSPVPKLELPGSAPAPAPITVEPIVNADATAETDQSGSSDNSANNSTRSNLVPRPASVADSVNHSSESHPSGWLQPRQMFNAIKHARNVSTSSATLQRLQAVLSTQGYRGLSQPQDAEAQVLSAPDGKVKRISTMATNSRSASLSVKTDELPDKHDTVHTPSHHPVSSPSNVGHTPLASPSQIHPALAAHHRVRQVSLSTPKGSPTEKEVGSPSAGSMRKKSIDAGSLPRSPSLSLNTTTSPAMYAALSKAKSSMHEKYASSSSGSSTPTAAGLIQANSRAH